MLEVLEQVPLSSESFLFLLLSQLILDVLPIFYQFFSNTFLSYLFQPIIYRAISKALIYLFSNFYSMMFSQSFYQ